MNPNPNPVSAQKRRVIVRKMLSETPPADLHGTATLLVRGVPRDIHAMFKSQCARRSRTMRGMLIAFMSDTAKGGEAIVEIGKLSRYYTIPR